MDTLLLEHNTCDLAGWLKCFYLSVVNCVTEFKYYCKKVKRMYLCHVCIEQSRFVWIAFNLESLVGRTYQWLSLEFRKDMIWTGSWSSLDASHLNLFDIPNSECARKCFVRLSCVFQNFKCLYYVMPKTSLACWINDYFSMCCCSGLFAWRSW